MHHASALGQKQTSANRPSIIFNLLPQDYFYLKSLEMDSNTASREAFNEVVQAISKDMPLIMHGSGDVQPSEVYPDSASVLSELTANYIAKLVEAAVNAHDILNDGPQPLPPPPLPHSKTIPKPSKPELKLDKKDNKKEENRKRRRATDEYWDEPMKEPKIKNKPATPQVTKGPKFEGVHVDEWVGVSGVDFFDMQRSRKAYVRAPSAIGASSFVFPVCHDSGLYGKVLELQTARRSIAPVLADPVVLDVIRNEGALQHAGRKRTKKTTSNEEEVEEPDETDSEGEDGAQWPGLDGLLPVYMNPNFAG